MLSLRTLTLLTSILAILLGSFMLLLDPITYPISSEYRDEYCINDLLRRVVSTSNDIVDSIEYDKIKGECYFSSDYYDARDRFISAAKKADASLYRFPLKDNNLTTDVAIIEGSDHKYLIHISGVHGTEGYAGSAIQISALELFSSNHYKQMIKDKQFPTIVFVHIVNPYGMANNRRVNEDNIDLNRNFLSLDEFEKVIEREPNFAGYKDIDFLINPSSLPYSYTLLNDIHSFGLTIYAAATYGLSFIKRALVSGNYFKPTGLGYGGIELSKSGFNLKGILIEQLNIGNIAKNLVLVDVHTGLGPSGKDTLAQLAGKRKRSVESIFPLEYEKSSLFGYKYLVGGMKESNYGSGPNSALAGYDLTVGTVTEDFCLKMLAPNLNDDSRLCILQEFGTRDMAIVGKTLTDENWAYHYGSNEEKKFYGKRLKSSFFVETTAWKRNVVRRGLKVFLQALNYSIKEIVNISESEL